MRIVRCKKCGQLWEFYTPQRCICDCGHEMVVDNAWGIPGRGRVEGNIPPTTRRTRLGAGGIRRPRTGQTWLPPGKVGWKPRDLDKSGG